MERLSIKSDVEKEVNAKQLDADTQRLRNLESILLKLYDEQADLNARWQAERQAVLGVNELQEKIAMTQLEIETAEREYDLNKAAELKYGTLSELEEQLQAAQTKEDQAEEGASDVGDSMLRDEVVPDDIGKFFFFRARLRPWFCERVRCASETSEHRPFSLVLFFFCSSQRHLRVDRHTLGQIGGDRPGTRAHHGRQAARARRGAGRGD